MKGLEGSPGGGFLIPEGVRFTVPRWNNLFGRLLLMLFGIGKELSAVDAKTYFEEADE